MRCVSVLAGLMLALGCGKSTEKPTKHVAPIAKTPTKTDAKEDKEARLKTPGGVVIPKDLPPKITKALQEVAVDRRRALQTLLPKAEIAKGAMTALLGSKNVEELLGALEFFEQTVERESVEATLELMSHPVSMVRHQALATLLKTAPGEHSEFIIGLLDDPDRDIRTFAVRSMTQFDTPGVTQALIIQLADPDERVTLEVAKALATKKGKLPLDTLIASVTSDQAATALGAIATLEALKSPIPLEVLKQAIGAEDLRVAAKAVRALLTGLDGPRAKHIEASLNAPRGEVRRVAVETLHEGHPTTAPAPTWLAESTLLEHLVKATRDAEEQVRASAVDALGERTAIDAVLERLAPALKDPSPIVRTAAYVRLSVRRAAGTAALLLPSLDTERDPHALGHLALSLARLEEKSAVEPLIGLLARATDKYARRQLSTALKKLTGQQLGTAAKRWREWLTEQEQGAPKTP